MRKFEIQKEVLLWIDKNIRIALKTFEEFYKENNEFFMSGDLEDLTTKGNIQSYAIKRQFYNESFNVASNTKGLNARLESTNNFGNKTLFLHNDYVSLTISKIPKVIALDKKKNNEYIDDVALFKRKLAANNYNEEINRIQLNFLEQEKTKDNRLYAQILYSYIDKDLRDLKIILPDSNMDYIIESIDILKEVSEIYDFDTSNEEEIRSVVSLKKELKEQFIDRMVN